MRVFKIDDPVFKTEPLFVTDCTYEEMRTYLNKRFRLAIEETPDCNEYLGMMLTFGKAPWRVVWWKRAGAIPVLVHEILHLVTRICQDKGIPICSFHPGGAHGDETAAYLQEHFLVNAMKLRRHKKRISC